MVRRLKSKTPRRAKTRRVKIRRGTGEREPEREVKSVNRERKRGEKSLPLTRRISLGSDGTKSERESHSKSSEK